MASSIRSSDGRFHGGAKRPLRGQSLKDVKSLRMVQNHPPQTDDDDDDGFVTCFKSFCGDLVELLQKKHLFVFKVFFVYDGHPLVRSHIKIFFSRFYA